MHTTLISTLSFNFICQAIRAIWQMGRFTPLPTLHTAEVWVLPSLFYLLRHNFSQTGWEKNLEVSLIQKKNIKTHGLHLPDAHEGHRFPLNNVEQYNMSLWLQFFHTQTDPSSMITHHVTGAQPSLNASETWPQVFSASAAYPVPNPQPNGALLGHGKTVSTGRQYCTAAPISVKKKLLCII